MPTFRLVPGWGVLTTEWGFGVLGFVQQGIATGITPRERGDLDDRSGKLL